MNACEKHPWGYRTTKLQPPKQRNPHPLPRVVGLTEWAQISLKLWSKIQRKWRWLMLVDLNRCMSYYPSPYHFLLLVDVGSIIYYTKPLSFFCVLSSYICQQKPIRILTSFSLSGSKSWSQHPHPSAECDHLRQLRRLDSHLEPRSKKMENFLDQTWCQLLLGLIKKGCKMWGVGMFFGVLKGRNRS